MTSPLNPISLMEDFAPERSQFSPVIGTDGNAFILGYIERFPLSDPGLTDYDVVMCSGSIAEDGSVARLGLSERHQLIFPVLANQQFPVLAMVQDGNRLSASDDGIIAFQLTDFAPTSTGGSLWFATVDANTTSSLLDRKAVGRQYCDANPNSSNRAAWIWLEGNQVAGATHWLRCVDMPTNVFSMPICSRQTGDFDLVGGQGRLCLGGSIGRFNGLVTGSGADGQVTIPIDTSALPSGSALVAAQAGETWHFQVWFRDFFQTSVTSNYSNAVSVTFNP